MGFSIEWFTVVKFAYMKILRLVRFKNLLIIAATMVLMRYFIMQPILQGFGLSLQLSTATFIMLVLATVFIAAAGYAINDYFDTRTDLVNRPGTVIVGKAVSRRVAIAIHLILSALGILLGTIVAIKVGRPVFSLLFILPVGILWFYSTIYKRQLLVGNIVVATLTGIVPLIPLIFEYPLFKVYWEVIVTYQLKVYVMVNLICGYALFAFLLTLVREIVKDMEDFEGDTVYGRNTLPVHFGIKASKITAASILILTLVSLIYLFYRHVELLPGENLFYISFLYFVFFILIPFAILIVMIFLAQDKRDFHRASVMNKILMLLGLIYTLVFWGLIHFS